MLSQDVFYTLLHSSVLRGGLSFFQALSLSTSVVVASFLYAMISVDKENKPAVSFPLEVARRNRRC